MRVCAWAALSRWHSPCSGAAQECVSLQLGSREGGFSGCWGERIWTGVSCLTLLPHPACCAQEGLELRNSFQYRGENFSVRQGDHGPLGVLVFVLHHAKEA